MLDPNLLDRLAARAGNPKTRKDAPHWDALLAETNVVTMETPSGLVAAACGLKQGPRPAPAPLPLAVPASAGDIAAAEARLGFPLPGDLAQLYGTIANGGFGPGSGLVPLKEAVAYYEALKAEPPSEGGQPWPAHLLPFNRYDLCCDCYDVKTGVIVIWDEESLLDGPGDSVWQGAFTKAADSLAAYLEAWLGTAPPKSDARYIEAADAGFPESDVVIDMWTVNHLRRSIEMLRQSPEHRETCGLSEHGWEEELCKAQDLDPDIYLEMIKRPAADDD